MARSSYNALEALVTAANEYAAATEACDMAAVEAGKKASKAVHKAAMINLEAAIIHLRATADYVLLASSMYEAAKGDKRDDK